jgi:hypothetical protein
MTTLNRQSILEAPDFKTVEVAIPEWGGSVYVRTLTSRQRDEFEQLVAGKSYANIRATLCAWTACDERGQRIFTDADIPKLGDKSAAATERIFVKALELAKFDDKDIEDLAKN